MDFGTYQLGLSFNPSNPQQPVTVTSSGSSAVPLSVTTDQSWIVVTQGNVTAYPASVTPPASITIVATPLGLSAGTYCADVKLGGSGASATIPVKVTTLAAPTGPAMNVTPATLSFTATQGGGNPLAQLLSVANINPTSTPQNMTFSVATDQLWLTAACTSCTTQESVPVSVAVGSLPAGTYNGNVTITSTTSGTTLYSPWKVPVTFTVTP